MKCPRSGTELKEIEIEGVRVDLSEACGGVWFDNFELAKFDEVHESGGDTLSGLMERYRSDDFDRSQRIRSPKHPEIVMVRRFFGPKKSIEIDVCPMSGGIWMDAGELDRIRETYPTVEDLERARKKGVEEAFEESGYAAESADSAEIREAADRVRNLFRWLIPGRSS